MPRRTSNWNHNIQYHGLVLRSLPTPCLRALDLGCGRGLLTRKLARHCSDVVGIDLDREALSGARRWDRTNITYVEGDALTHPFAEASFDFIAGIAVLHHMPLRPALARLAALLKPGGVLCLIGLYRAHSAMDYLAAAAAVPASLAVRGFRGQADVGAPVSDACETLAEIRAAATVLLPGSRVRRLLFFRYALKWKRTVEEKQP